MSLFPVSGEKVQFSTAAVSAGDVYTDGLRYTTDGKVRASTGSVAYYSQGIPMTSDGQVCIVDATASLPAGTIYNSGIPLSSEKVCYSTNTAAVYLNGMPYVTNGALSVTITP